METGCVSKSNGRAPGSRQAFSSGFLKDLAEVWAEHGRERMIKTAKDQPTTFFAVCARLIPSDVKLIVEQTYGGLSEQPIVFVESSPPNTAAVSAAPAAWRCRLRPFSPRL